MSDDRNGPRSTTSAQQRRVERASAKRQEAERELASSRKAEKKLARREASEHRKAQRTSAKRRAAQQEAAEHRRSERELAARRQVEHVAVEQQRVAQEVAARRQAQREEAQRKAAARREAQKEIAERRRADREAAERREAERHEAERQEAARHEAERQEAARHEAERQETQRHEAARGKTRRDRPERGTAPQRRTTDQPDAQASPAKQKAPGLLLLLAGLAAGALVAAVISARKTAKEAPTVSERELTLRDEEAWTYETKLVVYAPAGAIAGHVHDVGGFPGLVGPLDGPPMDRVDWTEPEGARLRFQVHARSGGGPSDTTVQVARGSRTGPLNGLEGEVRDALAALRTQLERA